MSATTTNRNGSTPVDRERVRDARLARRLTLAQAAKLIGIGTTALRLIENGETLPFDATMFRIADAYGEELAVLFPEVLVPRAERVLPR